jgi:hypothetical protein
VPSDTTTEMLFMSRNSCQAYELGKRQRMVKKEMSSRDVMLPTLLRADSQSLINR